MQGRSAPQTAVYEIEINRESECVLFELCLIVYVKSNEYVNKLDCTDSVVKSSNQCVDSQTISSPQLFGYHFSKPRIPLRVYKLCFST